MSGLFASYRMTRINENSGTVRLLFFRLILLTLAGCQSFPCLEDPRPRDEQTFQHMWRLYSHCPPMSH